MADSIAVLFWGYIFNSRSKGGEDLLGLGETPHLASLLWLHWNGCVLVALNVCNQLKKKSPFLVQIKAVAQDKNKCSTEMHSHEVRKCSIQEKNIQLFLGFSGVISIAGSAYGR